MSRAPIRTIGIRDPTGLRAPESTFAGERRGASSVKRARASEGRRIAIGGHGGKKLRRVRLIGPGRMECAGIVLKTLSVRPVPALDGRGRPFRRFVGMAVVAGIGRAELHRQVRPRNPQAVIVPRIDRPCRCAPACGTTRRRPARFDARHGGYEPRWRICPRVALQADAVAGHA